VWEKPDVVFMPESLCDCALSSGVRVWEKPDVKTRLSTRYEKLKDDLCREECNFKCIEMKLGTNLTDLDLQYQHEASQRIMVSKRASMKDMELRIRESCQILQLPAEDFVSFEDVT
jgi:hypothetical protein